ncbi:MAG: Cytochrome c biogenesis protein [Candidatus Woesebacteria bacterium GW2011_GWC2_47_16]|uniref:Cytochrome c biogenesis protein n=9 Tax=Candidatus Woeseibacteriota TaxID=1752722 RepID=A0A0G1TNV7_9BACT|nr:MAG: Cytochrome c biogenesis protein [Candidatus Woesebacteria bacterium GW2011_GWE1_45_18]KKU25086.1 MAG: Cytochrome c biogenesis protein [Candidatus Woesebacteria bacterium GW2011_GWF1_46_13]KKU47060.1 MAG: Cytochrome c biogenesis protein [Candidatus Woesebacteria bacterium GW2011_GWF2_46_8]KKU65333.1 MAG: Cytochrome c biogenesis protein [Candidatus Woesebacteria bacterium GW2011_GWC2_47_16]KKU71248.1 MAG: Cytochrome c biogenesis protein [Candidatus Woesebacteria bacterium GW2011_GWD1_47_2
MIELNYWLAFSAGLVSFFAPCVVPLLPAYVGYVTGVSLKDLKTFGYKPYFKKLLLSSIFYIFGFSIVFVLLGTAAATIGMNLRRYDFLIQKIGGLIILVLGLQFAGILNLPFLARQKQFSLPPWVQNLGYLRAFFVGVVFATVWTPCVGAVLGSILTLAAVSKTVLTGASLLFVYSLGIAVPFLIVAVSLASAPRYIGFISRHIGVISRVAGIILAILGLLLLTDTYKYLNAWLFDIAFKVGYKIR